MKRISYFLFAFFNSFVEKMITFLELFYSICLFCGFAVIRFCGYTVIRLYFFAVIRLYGCTAVR